MSFLPVDERKDWEIALECCRHASYGPFQQIKWVSYQIINLGIMRHAYQLAHLTDVEVNSELVYRGTKTNWFPFHLSIEYFLFYFIYLFLERGREGEKEGEKCQCVVASRTPPTGDLAQNPGVCPDWEWNQ